jgi:hypothetical protein
VGGGAGGGDQPQPAAVRGHLFGQLVEQLYAGTGQMAHAGEVDGQREDPAPAGVLEVTAQVGGAGKVDRPVHRDARRAHIHDVDVEPGLAGRGCLR